jgi:hypothetical protein
MGIDIDRLTEAEPTGANRRIAGRLRFPRPMRAHAAMLKFPVVERVSFGTGDFRKVAGTPVRHNKKTVSVLAGDGQHWNVSPGLPQSAEPRDITPAAEVLPVGIPAQK